VVADAASRVLRIGHALAVTGAVVQTAATVAAIHVLDGRGQELLDARVEGSVWTWASSVATFAGGFVAALYALSRHGLRRELLVLATVLTLFSLDDATVLHEHAGEALSAALGAPEYVGARAWLGLYPPLFAAAVWALWRAVGELPAARPTLVAGVVLLGSAIALELVGIGARWLDERGTSWPRTTESVLEEGVELAGWTLVAAALAATLVARLAPAPSET